jgi:phosphatidylethanolamine/phosphatidyl-N-methylethanolamine N-methyltransferase
MNKIYNIYSYIYYYLFGFYILDGLKKSASIVQENDYILDIGIGTGIILKYLPKNAKIIGIDLNVSMLDVAKRDIENQIKSNQILFSY